MSGSYHGSKAITPTPPPLSWPSSPPPSRPRVGFVTIGQSPRDDVVPEMLAWLGTPVDAVQAGALDGCSDDEIGAMAPGLRRAPTREPPP